MKRIARVIICFLLIAGLAYTPVTIPQLADTQAVAVAEAATVKLNSTSIKLYTKGTYKLKVTGTSKTVKWSSAKSSIATVDANGVVTAKKVGTTTITAKVGSKKLKCTVKVCYAPKMNWSAASVYAGAKKTLKVSNAIGTIKWTSSNPKVATVSSTGVVTGKVAGTTVISAKIKNKTVSCKITVKKRMSVDKTDIKFSKISGSSTVKVTFVAPGDWTIYFNVDDTDVATAKWSKNWEGDTTKLYIYPEGEGTTYVRLTNSYNKQVVKIKVTVTDKLWNSDSLADAFDDASDASYYVDSAGDYVEWHYKDWGYYKYDAVDELYEAVENLASLKATTSKKDPIYCEGGYTVAEAAVMAYDACYELIDLAYEVTADDVMGYMDYLMKSTEVLAYLLEIELAIAGY